MRGNMQAAYSLHCVCSLHFPGACGKARWLLDICGEAFACIFQHLDDYLAAAGVENLRGARDPLRERFPAVGTRRIEQFRVTFSGYNRDAAIAGAADEDMQTKAFYPFFL